MVQSVAQIMAVVRCNSFNKAFLINPFFKQKKTICIQMGSIHVCLNEIITLQNPVINIQ